MFESVPSELKELNQWVCVRSDSKAPMMATELSPASSSDYKTWSSFESAVAAVQGGFYDNIGFVFADNNIVGIDIDCGFDEDGFISPVAADILGHCRSYAELSRSGRGFHILLKGTLPFKGRNNQHGVEIYRTGRYFIVTGDQTLYQEMRNDQQAIDYIVSTYFPDVVRDNSEKRNCERAYSPVWDKPGKTIPMRAKYPEIKPGSRNLCLTSLAGILRNAGFSRSKIYEELIRCNETACKPPLERLEIRCIVNSVMRYQK